MRADATGRGIPGLKVAGADQLPGTANYFIGNDPAKWRANVPTYGRVKYTGVYPGWTLSITAISASWNTTSSLRPEPIPDPSTSASTEQNE